MTFLYVWSTASWWADTFSAYVRCFILSAYYWENLRVNIRTNDDSNENVDENMWKHDYSFFCFLFPELVSTSNVKILMFSNFLHPDIYVIYVKLSIILENKRWKQYNNKQKFDKSLTLTRVIILKRSTKYRFQINLKISIPPSYFYLFCIRTNCFLIHSKKNCRIDNFRIDNDRRYMVVYFISLQK